MMFGECLKIINNIFRYNTIKLLKLSHLCFIGCLELQVGEVYMCVCACKVVSHTQKIIKQKKLFEKCSPKD